MYGATTKINGFSQKARSTSKCNSECIALCTPHEGQS